MIVLYNILLIIIFPFFICIFYPLSFFIKKWRKGFFKKMGYYDSDIGIGGNIVFHCVSVGETLSAAPLIKRFAEERSPDLMLTVTTDTGMEVANKNLKGVVKTIQFFPFDFPFSLARFIRLFTPAAFIITETEIWPNLILFCRKLGLPVIFINGRISDRSFPRYLRFRWFFRKVLDYPYFLMQTDRDRERIIRLGAAPEKVFASGNIKYDINLNSGAVSRCDIGIADSDKVFIAGSTHPGEEDILLDAFLVLKNDFPDLKMIIGPRHPERFADVAAFLDKRGIVYGRRSKKENIRDVLLLDTIGELSMFYEISDVAFVGGSLVDIGGHNILEPAAFSKPVLFGKYMQNFREMSEEFITEEGGIEIDANRIKGVLNKLLGSADLRQWHGTKAKMIVEKNRGSIERTLNFIDGIFKASNIGN